MPEAVEEVYDENGAEEPLSIYQLKPKMRLEGTVTRLALFGAFVDVGVEAEGLIHISQLSTRRVNRVSEVVSEGDNVSVWVLGVEPDNKRINLTMVEPPAVDWDDLRSGQVFSGTIKRIERFGAFVDIGATRDGLVHVSEITSDYIQDPREFVKVGQDVQVKVLKVDHQRRRIELSMKAVEEHLVSEEDTEDLDEIPTAMEHAWRQASGTSAEHQRKSRRKRTRQQRNTDDIFTRTLRLRSDQE